MPFLGGDGDPSKTSHKSATPQYFAIVDGGDRLLPATVRSLAKDARAEAYLYLPAGWSKRTPKEQWAKALELGYRCKKIGIIGVRR